MPPGSIPPQINYINIRLDARRLFPLETLGCNALLVDADFFDLTDKALSMLAKQDDPAIKRPLLVVVDDDHLKRGSTPTALYKGAVMYEDFLLSGDPNFNWVPPEDEWQSIALSYTSGTTTNPKGVVVSHRGAYLSSLAACLSWGHKDGCVYLWTLPLFHCNGRCFPWGIAAVAGTNVCLRQVTAKSIHSAIAEHGVTHFGAAPVVLNTILSSQPHEKKPIKAGVQVMTAGSLPPPTVLAGMEAQGFVVTHTYGLTETYGPSTICAWKSEWDVLPSEDRARLKARQGVRYIALEGLDIVNPKTMIPVPADGRTLGEVVMQGNMVMKGYLNNPEANRESFRGGWFHSGDLGVKHPDNYIEIKDRSKDIIISGGENISSLEVESILYQHPKVLEASVVARPDEKWGESPCAFVTLREGAVNSSDLAATEQEIIDFCFSNLPHFMVPKSVVFGPLPKTATGKIQKHLLRSQANAQGPLSAAYPRNSATSRL